MKSFDFRQTIVTHTPCWIKNIVYRHRWKIKQNNKNIANKISRLRSSGRAVKILFIISNLPMWRAQRLYNLLKKDLRFEPKIIVSPFQRYNEDECDKIKHQVISYLTERGISDYLIADTNLNLEKFLDIDFDPDIIFPSQYYDNVYGNKLDYLWNRKRIYCYIPYGLNTVKEQFAYNSEFHNNCLKFYQASILHLKTAKRMMANKGKNIVVVGEPDYDKFIECKSDPWKKITDGKQRKRIIWAPHFSINPTDILHRASFLWLYDEMPNIAVEYKDSVQIAFKPHPNLHNALCQLEGWGARYTQEYYNKWALMENTQLEEGDFMDLFKYSDAMIHDSGSFTGEYLFVNKPVMFTTKNVNALREGADDFGLRCIDLHYIGKDIDGIRSFIEDVVLKENDKLKEERSSFYNEYLIPPNGKSVAENIYNDLLESLGFSKQ